mgnify:CR=1 FL=1
MKTSGDTESFAGHLVAQNMLFQVVLGQIVVNDAGQGTAIREAMLQRTEAIESNPNMSEAEKFGDAKTLEDALDTIDRIYAGAHGT